uniref:Protein kinase domain-containing protein n=1 Tax=Macrostomum lignano TaxID=282301 RepID=A0A1I8FU02_9PLAT
PDASLNSGGHPCLSGALDFYEKNRYDIIYVSVHDAVLAAQFDQRAALRKSEQQLLSASSAAIKVSSPTDGETSAAAQLRKRAEANGAEQDDSAKAVTKPSAYSNAVLVVVDDLPFLHPRTGDHCAELISCGFVPGHGLQLGSVPVHRVEAVPVWPEVRLPVAAHLTGGLENKRRVPVRCQRKSMDQRTTSERLLRLRCGVKLLNSRKEPYGTSRVTGSLAMSTPNSFSMMSSSRSMYQVGPAQQWHPGGDDKRVVGLHVEVAAVLMPGNRAGGVVWRLGAQVPHRVERDVRADDVLEEVQHSLVSGNGPERGRQGGQFVKHYVGTGEVTLDGAKAVVESEALFIRQLRDFHRNVSFNSVQLLFGEEVSHQGEASSVEFVQLCPTQLARLVAFGRPLLEQLGVPLASVAWIGGAALGRMSDLPGVCESHWLALRPLEWAETGRTAALASRLPSSADTGTTSFIMSAARSACIRHEFVSLNRRDRQTTTRRHESTASRVARRLAANARLLGPSTFIVNFSPMLNSSPCSVCDISQSLAVARRLRQSQISAPMASFSCRSFSNDRVNASSSPAPTSCDSAASSIALTAGSTPSFISRALLTSLRARRCVHLASSGRLYTMLPVSKLRSLQLSDARRPSTRCPMMSLSPRNRSAWLSSSANAISSSACRDLAGSGDFSRGRTGPTRSNLARLEFTKLSFLNRQLYMMVTSWNMRLEHRSLSFPPRYSGLHDFSMSQKTPLTKPSEVASNWQNSVDSSLRSWMRLSSEPSIRCSIRRCFPVDGSANFESRFRRYTCSASARAFGAASRTSDSLSDSSSSSLRELLAEKQGKTSELTRRNNSTRMRCFHIRLIKRCLAQLVVVSLLALLLLFIARRSEADEEQRVVTSAKKPQPQPQPQPRRPPVVAILHQSGVQRADVARLFYMHRYGGVYCDLDCDCLRGFQHLLANTSLALGAMEGSLIPERENPAFVDEGQVENSFMYSQPRHPFFWELILRLNATQGDLPIMASGTYLLMTGIRSARRIGLDRTLFSGLPYLTVYPPSLFNPFSWINPQEGRASPRLSAVRAVHAAE